MAHNTPLKFASYWRNCLADAERNNGALGPAELEAFIRQAEPLAEPGLLDEQAVAKCFAGEPADAEHIEVSLRPCIFASLLDHGCAPKGVPRYVTPVVSEALLTRDGKLWPKAKTQVPRDILEPLEAGSFAISTVTAVDEFMSVARPHPDPEWTEPQKHAAHWANYLKYVERLLAAICPGWPGADDNYCRLPELLVMKEASANGASRHIVALYENIRSTKPEAALFDRYAALDYAPPSPCLASDAGFAERLAHSNAEYPLAKAQRDALTHILSAPEGDILAVNGPPGTGKTTLLLSVVATLWTRAALGKPDAHPPIIVACSTNNQAVTNILDAFAKDFSSGSGPFAGRWLADVQSFGAYLPAHSKEAKAAQKYQTRQFFTNLETPQALAKATEQFLGKATAAFPETTSLTLEKSVVLLRERIAKHAAQLKTLADTWAELSQARLALQRALGAQSWVDAQNREREKQLAQEMEQIVARQHALERHLANESIFLALFDWIPAVATKRASRARLAMRNSGLPPLIAERELQMQSWRTLKEFESALAAWATEAAAALEAERLRLKSLDQLREAETLKLKAWQLALQPLGDDFAKRAANLDLAGCDPRADTALRFPIFLLTSHYWEGRWLLEMQANLNEVLESTNKTGRRTLSARWRRWMKLTPCVVSTFYMLPDKLRASRKDGEDWKADYLYGFADLLIVDEAGQVQPEVAGASFALARKALVIGDTEQIEPIWSSNVAVDQGNLIAAGLLPAANNEAIYERIGALGKSAASGSVMRIAQNASRYHYDNKLARGMYLYEHRRCYDSIVAYCNQLCYQGRLKPMRKDPAALTLPPFGYLHVAGICQRAQGRSRHNLLEAETIATWVAEKRAELEARYQKDISKIVGIVTPFGAQTRAIEEACNARALKTGKDEDAITVGTVHSLQGAARPIVIFSAVYSKHADGGFIDQRKSMLNVAVSRAEDSFLVFGDMDLFTLAQAGSPRALLAHYLFHKPDNELSFVPQPRRDLQTVRTGLRHLHDAKEHDEFLLAALGAVSREIHIVSPWLNIARIEEIGAMIAMRQAVERGVRVIVYTDLELNVGTSKDVEPKTDLLREAFKILISAGIDARVMQRVHSKLLMSDDDLLCVGSFNWFSASRNPNFARHETSMIYHGPDVSDEIKTNLASLDRLVIRMKTA